MTYNIYDDIQGYLRYSRKLGRTLADQFLHDFKLAFRGNSDNWSVPPEQEAEYRALERQEKQAKDGLTAANCDFVVDETGNLIIRQGVDAIQIGAQDRTAFSSALFKLPARGGHQLGPGIANPGQSSAQVYSQNYKVTNDPDRPEMKERMERSIQEIERWAMASAERYPKRT